ncbi:MAG: aminomethyl-transferring glycine dehydrogenase subunit GcvPA [Anaerolineae bacterium]
MVYTPHTPEERRQMLETIGIESLEDLFADIPQQYRFPNLDLPRPVSEMEILHELQATSRNNVDANEHPTFLGAGAYRHWVPTVVDYVIRRGEFATAYTPYQAEISQGTLQSIFEYQSLICDLTGMEVANASHYDGATATAEAAIQAHNVFRKRRRKILIAPTVNPQYRAVVRTYTQGMDVTIAGDASLEASVADLVAQVDDETACVIVQSPNFLGQIEDLAALVEGVRDRNDDTLVAVVTNPISLGLFKPPGEYGVDIVVGDGQPLGLGLNFGGPYLGFYATKMDYIRQMAGRVAGKTTDTEGEVGYVLTLTTREQHIRRDRATSNICTNQGLMALAATVYLSTLGQHGFRQIAELNYHKAHYAAEQIDQLDGFAVSRAKPFFNEFVVRCPAPAQEINRYLLDGGYENTVILGGYDLGRDFPERADEMLVAVTEMNTRAEIDLFVNALAAFARSERRSS